LFSSNDTLVVAEAGSSAAGQVATTIVADTGATVQLAASFTFLTAGAIQLLSPARGQLGTLVTIQGTGLLGGGSQITAVLLSGIAVHDLESGNNTHVVVRAGASATAGAGNVSITSDSGATTVLVDGWTYNIASAISGVSPASGQVGTRVVVSGTNLLGQTDGSSIVQALLAGRAAQVVNSTGTRVDLIAAANAAATGDVVLTANTGALSILGNGWTYLAAGRHQRGDACLWAGRDTRDGDWRAAAGWRQQYLPCNTERRRSRGGQLEQLACAAARQPQCRCWHRRRGLDGRLGRRLSRRRAHGRTAWPAP
jgi:hypothetical protein